ncbi:MAG: Uma2 family endonuclease [Desulfococcaceae bacterium]
MLKPASRKVTYEDIEALPENLIGEIIDGELIAVPRPSYLHSHVASSLTEEISGPFQKGKGGPGGWILLYEPEVRLGRNLLVPDLAGWKKDRLTTPPDKNYATTPPDWICEILSPSTIRTDRIRKMPLYARFGVDHAWLIDPAAKTVEVFGLMSDRWVLMSVHGENECIRAEPFQAVEIALEHLWWE